MNIDALWNNKKSIKAATGLENDEAEELLADFIELRKQKKKSRKPFSSSQKYISMALNNLYADQ